MGEPQRIDAMEIVGYADVLTDEMLPSVVPPVYRLRADANRLFVPPYHENGGALYNATEIDSADFASMDVTGDVTSITTAPIPARAGHELWIDEGFAYRYEPAESALANLTDIYNREFANAKAALVRHDFVAAEAHARKATRADDRRYEPFVVRAAIFRVHQDREGERLMARLINPRLGADDFDTLVASYLRESIASAPAIASSTPGPWHKHARANKPMEKMAAYQPQLGIPAVNSCPT